MVKSWELCATKKHAQTFKSAAFTVDFEHKYGV